jgi:hypothetical protein
MFWWRHRSPTDDRLLTQLGTPASLAWLLVVSALAKLLDEAGSLEQFLEAAQSCSDWFSLVDTHPQRHESSFKALVFSNLSYRHSKLAFLIAPVSVVAASPALVSRHGHITCADSTVPCASEFSRGRAVGDSITQIGNIQLLKRKRLSPP